MQKKKKKGLSNLVKYIRNNRGHRRGVLVAVKHQDGSVFVDYSLCCKKDKFDKDKGLGIAMGRANRGDRMPLPRFLPHSLREAMSEFRERATKYFKVDKVETNFKLEVQGTLPS